MPHAIRAAYWEVHEQKAFPFTCKVRDKPLTHFLRINNSPTNKRTSEGCVSCITIHNYVKYFCYRWESSEFDMCVYSKKKQTSNLWNSRFFSMREKMQFWRQNLYLPCIFYFKDVFLRNLEKHLQWKRQKKFLFVWLKFYLQIKEKFYFINFIL